MSQENISDKVRSLQRQIAQNIKFPQKPSSQRRAEGEEGSSDEEEAPSSPLRVAVQVEAEPGEAEPRVPGPSQTQGGDQGSSQTQGADLGPSPPLKSPRPRRVPATGTIESVNLDAVPQSVPRLDNTAAKHKLSVKPKNQRVSRKHRRFTQEIVLPDVLQEEDVEATGISTDSPRRTLRSTDEDHESLERSKKQRLQEEERRESRRRREMEDQRRREEEEERCLRQQEEQRLRREEEEERRQREEAERRRREEEERRVREEEERRMREEEERLQREEEEGRIREEEMRKQREQEERRRLEEQRKKEEEERRLRLRLEEEERLRELEQERLREAAAAAERTKREEEEEELRWREMEERQRPFSFKVSSGEKQILFHKVNLTPPEAPSSSNPASPTSSAQYVPHTAILVTGAQLCGPAVNLDQIRDTACKSLLGLGDDKKAMATPKGKTSPERKSGKTKSLNESSADQSGSAVLAEWASIRSKIFKGAEEGGRYEEEPGQNQSSSPGGGETQAAPFPHTNLRKTMSASAKFSITPAKKKFSDSKRNSEVLSQEGAKDAGGRTEPAPPDCPSPTPSAGKAQDRAGKTVRIAHRTEGCQFAKDLPSFLVPSPAQGSANPEGPETDAESRGGAYQSDERREGEAEESGPDGQDKPSPFGIKLRRTNYSLRFHNEQPTEKRKKRYSAGDSFDGVPSPLTPIEPDSDTPSPSSPLRESAGSKPAHVTAPVGELRARAGKAPSPVPPCEAETPAKPSVYQRAGVSSKPSSSPSSSLPRTGRGGGSEALAKRVSVAEAGREERAERRAEPSAVAQLQRSAQGEEEPKEKKSFFPSISIPWREKADRKTELIRKEKPSLQSRHSLDSARMTDKEAGPLRGQTKEAGPLRGQANETGGPMWITLALQKQKGFREQQQTRDDRRSQREAKLAEKQARDADSCGSSVPSGSRASGHSSRTVTPVTPEPPEEAKRPDSLLGRFERRDNLKKANTLPSSVTVEITDSPSPPAVKEVSKRFPGGDSPGVCTEPAWLALAKRKAKAWSDCPQIIK